MWEDGGVQCSVFSVQVSGLGGASPALLGGKSEIRNPKQIQNPKLAMTETPLLERSRETPNRGGF